MENGTIKRLTDRGFGFLATDGNDLFFHSSALEGVTFDQLREGQAVTYEIGEGQTGPQAVSVRLR